jgi:KDO2-lipid IV(A) lauroyltransferase
MPVELPARWGRAQRWKNTLIYWVICLALAVFRLVPFWLAVRVGGWLGRVAGVFAFKERQRAVRQLGMALPELEPRYHRRIAEDMFEHLGVSAVETLKADYVFAHDKGPKLSPEQAALVNDALSEGKGVVLVGGHIGNWELLSHAFARADLPMNAIAKPLYDPRLTALADKTRRQFGSKILWRGKPQVGKDMLRVFKKNEILGLLIDQDTKVQGAFVPFFGKLAYTPIAAAALAIRFNAPIVLAWAHRYPDGFEVHVERFTRSSDDVESITAELTKKLEKAIRKVPAQWVWLHDRWKRKPAAHAANDDGDADA